MMPAGAENVPTGRRRHVGGPIVVGGRRAVGSRLKSQAKVVAHADHLGAVRVDIIQPNPGSGADARGQLK